MLAHGFIYYLPNYIFSISLFTVFFIICFLLNYIYASYLKEKLLNCREFISYTKHVNSMFFEGIGLCVMYFFSLLCQL